MDREVAIKILTGFAADPERLARFRREAKLLASLNHPNIASIYGVHKVLDFGLAKAMTPEGADESGSPSMSPTVTLAGTVAGTILGTASYMSPEQARGKPVDRRADIWSFGAVLFELFSGRRVFEGESISETLAAVLMKDPDWSALPSHTPVKVRRLLRRCLTRDPTNRLQDIGEARIALQEVLVGDADVVEAGAIGSASTWSRRAAPWLGLGVLLGLAVGWGLVSLRDSPQSKTTTSAIMRFAVQAPQSIESILNFAAAPDDRYVVYQGRMDGVSGLYLHDFESGTVRRLAGTEGGVDPFLSPDGRWVGFRRGSDLMKLRLAGGDAVKICDVPEGIPGASWGPDDTILFLLGWLQGLWSVSTDGGEPVPITTVDVDAGEKGHWWPRFLPDGRHALFTIWNSGAGLIDVEIAVLDVQTGEYRKILRGADARFLPPGYLVFYQAGSYHAIAFDPDTREIAGDSTPVLTDATDPSPDGTEELGLTISDRGTLFYNADPLLPAVRLAVVEPGTAPRILPFPSRFVRSVAASSDGRTIATSSLESGVYVIRLLDLQSGTDERVDLSGSSWCPLWEPDGSGFAFCNMRKGDFDVYFKDVRASEPEQPIRIAPTDEQPLAWSTDGTALLVWVTLPDGGHSVVAVTVDGSSDESTVIADLDVEGMMMSRDGEWLAYSSTRGGVSNIYVRPYPAPGAEVRVSPDGGRQPAWSPDGAELYYIRRDNSIVGISYTVEQGRFRPGKEEVFFQSPLLRRNMWPPLAVLGRRSFVVPLLEAEPEPPHLNVVLNWNREVAARLAAR